MSLTIPTADTITDKQIHVLKCYLKIVRNDPKSPRFDKAHGLFGPGPDLSACADAINRHLSPEHRRSCKDHCAKLIVTLIAEGVNPENLLQ